MRNLHTVSQSGCTSLHSHQPHISIFFSLFPHEVLLFVFLIIAVLTGMRWYHDFNLHFLDEWFWASFYLLVGHLYVLFGKMYTQIFCPFENQIVFLLLSCVASLYILNISPLSGVVRGEVLYLIHYIAFSFCWFPLLCWRFLVCYNPCLFLHFLFLLLIAP